MYIHPENQYALAICILLIAIVAVLSFGKSIWIFLKEKVFFQILLLGIIMFTPFFYLYVYFEDILKKFKDEEIFLFGEVIAKNDESEEIIISSLELECSIDDCTPGQYLGYLQCYNHYFTNILIKSYRCEKIYHVIFESEHKVPEVGERMCGLRCIKKYGEEILRYKPK